ncbi:MAG: succinylglutamate desuccinylase/aspartoacylase family protein [Candidatus Latescibacteria bacterium]|nr:succinylglutamate desuccinylase/aspartoacylase family protein [Candidatus Latescibacterota bacterium]
MARTIATPTELDLVGPGRRDYLVSLEHDSIWGEFLIPLTVIVGPQATPGKGLVAFGSNHGNEYEGPVVLKNLLGEIDMDQVLGRLILIPVLNVAAFRAGTRDSSADDGVNLNRAFVDQAGKTPALAGITHRIAAFVREYLWPQVHVVIDLHSGGEVARFSPCASYHPLEDPVQSRQIEEAARWFGTPLVMVYQNRTPGLLPSEAERLGKITIGTDLGWGAAVSATGVRWGRQGVLAAAIRFGQLRGEISPIDHHADGSQRKVAIVERACFVPAPYPGLYQPLVECGTRVERGQTVGLLHDYNRIDEQPCQIQAGVEGIVVAQAWRARVEQGQHILVVGPECPWED